MADIAELGYRIDSRQALEAERNLNRMGRSTQNVTRLLGGFAVALGAAFSFNAAISQARRLDAAIGELSTLIPGATQQLDEMTRASREFGASFGTGTQAQASAFYAAVSAGATNAAEAIARVDAANRLAIGGVASLEASIAILNTATNAYAASNLSAADAADVLFTGVRTGVTTIPELSAALGRAIPAAVAVGVEFDELVGAVSALTTQGQNTNIAVTSLTAALSQLTNPSQQAREIAQQLGIEFNATAVEAMGLVGFMENLVEATDGNQETMAQLFGSVEALRAVFSLAGEGGERFADIMGEMEGRAGAADAAFGTMAERLSTRWNVVMATASARTEELGGVLLGVIVPAAEQFILVLQGSEDATLAAEIAVKALATTAGVLAVMSIANLTAGVVASTGAAIRASTTYTAYNMVLIRYGQTAAIAATASRGLGIAIRFALGPIGLAVTAVGLLTAAWVTQDSAVERLNNRYSDLHESLQRVEGVQASLRRGTIENVRASLEEARAALAAADAENERAEALQRSRIAMLETARDRAGMGSQLRISLAEQIATAREELALLDQTHFAATLDLAGSISDMESELQSLLAAERNLQRERTRTTETTRTATDEYRDAITALQQSIAILRTARGLERDVAEQMIAAGLSTTAMGEQAARIRELVSIRRSLQIDETIADFTEEAATVGMSTRQISLYTLELEGATEAQLRMANAALTTVEAWEKQQNVRSNLSTVTGDLDKEFTDPLQALRNEMLERQNILQEAFDLELLTREEYQARMTQVEQSYANARNDMMLAAGESMFGSLSGMARQFAGEQSGIFKALFLAEQAFALSRAIINAQVALSQAAAAAPPPANIPLIAMAAAQTLPPITTIAAQTVAGLHSGGSVFVGGAGGIDNNMMSINGQPVARVERGERIDVVPRARQGANDNGQEVRVNNELRLINETGVPMQMEWVTRDEVRLIVAQDAPRAAAQSLNDPSSELSSAVTSNTSARRVR
jgi:TP901 family phage tail tape measure protein